MSGAGTSERVKAGSGKMRKLQTGIQLLWNWLLLLGKESVLTGSKHTGRNKSLPPPAFHLPPGLPVDRAGEELWFARTNPES